MRQRPAVKRGKNRIEPITGLYSDILGTTHIAEHASETTALHRTGVRIAILDTCPDLSIPQLARSVTLHNLGGDAPEDHGTTVALLINHIAPEAPLPIPKVWPIASRSWLLRTAEIRPRPLKQARAWAMSMAAQPGDPAWPCRSATN
jgi:hypothetical protein